MEVREIKEADLKPLLALYGHLYEEDDQAPEDVLTGIWQEILHLDLLKYYVVELEGKLVSTCNITVIPNLTRGGRSIGLIENVVTHPDYRQMGLGKLVLDTAEAYARSRNCYKIMLLSNSKRKTAHRFYEGLGYSGTEKVGFVKKLH